MLVAEVLVDFTPSLRIDLFDVCLDAALLGEEGLVEARFLLGLFRFGK